MMSSLYKKFIFLSFITACSFAVLENADAQSGAPGSAISDYTQSRDTIMNTDASKICPEPRDALLNSPDDLSKIQEEITRLNLCVRRAQLLERLNSLVLKNLETIDTAIEANFSLNVPEIDLPSLDDIQIEALASSQSVPSSNTSASIEDVRESEWFIQDIKGGRSDMQAILVDKNNNVLRASVGTKLSGDAGIVESITAAGVQVKSPSGTVRLKWMN